MLDKLTPEQEALLVDRETGVVNDSHRINGFTLDELLHHMEAEGQAQNTESLGGHRVEDFQAARQRPVLQTTDAATFEGLSADGLSELLLGLVNTRTFKGASFEASQGYWTHLVTVEADTEREDFIFGLFGGGLDDTTTERPVALLRLGVEGRGSEVMALSGQFTGEFVTRTVPGEGVIYTELWYGAPSRGPLMMACANSTRAHTYGLPAQTPVELASDGLLRLSYESAMFQSEFEAQIQPLQDELLRLKTKLTNLKNNR